MRDSFSSRCVSAIGRLAHALRSARLSEEEHYVRMAYLVLLRRHVDPHGLRTWRDYIEKGRFDQQYVVDAILQSEEYLTRFGVNLINVIHRSRQEWIKTVPPFESILDIGGSSPTEPAGALIQLGYLHRPKRIDILDLPPDKQYWGKPQYDQSRSTRFDWGEVTYFHGSGEGVADVVALQGRTYDCVFLGQAIEHIHAESLPGTLEWALRHLSPQGRLVFDTPNRLLTKIQCPDSLIDPDHKYEYTPAEMESVVSACGFQVVKKVGMVHLPVQAASGMYDPREFADAPLLSEDVDACYLFAFEAMAR